MNPTQARQLVKQADFDALEDLLAPAIAIRPRVLYASEPRHKRARWLDWLLKPSVEGPVVETVPVLDELTLPIGVSRFDSVPDVPIGFEWPCTASGEMMECIAQVDLVELQAERRTPLLPSTGWLIFFIGVDSSEWEHRVAYVFPEPLTRWSTQAPRGHTRRTCRLDFEPVFSLPDAHDRSVKERIEFVGSRIGPYVKLQERLTDGARHYLLGYPRAIGDDVLAPYAGGQPTHAASRERASLVGNDWSLLLQLDSDSDDDGPGWMWGDAGSIYYVIRKDDLRAGRFDRTRLVVQSC